jgi:alkylation response protein AidB-like acyl-CoA dehydrogenase
MKGFEFSALREDERHLQEEVRAFLREDLPSGSFEPGLGIAGAKDPAFSARLGARGWLGMALPTEYGGHDRSAVDRFIVTEELLRWGAPIGHHWVADRQTGPMLATYGSEEQKRRFLPAIAAGEICFCIGMSEPDSGSDLASLVTRARRVDGGWVLDGTKIWTTWGDRADWIVVLCRTAPAAEASDKRAGLTQLIVDLTSPGVTRTPIVFIDGTAEFAEVVFDGVFVPDELVLGEPGTGWSQNTSELAYERGGPDRWLSPYLALEGLLRRWEDEGVAPDDVGLEMVGLAVAHLRVFHLLTLAVARAVDRGDSPVAEAALLKEMATRFEQKLVREVLDLVSHEPRTLDTPFDRVLATAAVTAPSFTIRGGTSEILRSVVAKGLQPSTVPPAGLRVDGVDAVLIDTVDRLFRDRATPKDVDAAAASGWDAGLWQAAAEIGLPWISLGPEAGGSGGTIADQLAVLRLVGRHAAPLPLAETAMLGGWLLAEAGLELPDGPIGVLAAPGALRLEDDRLVGGGTVGWAADVACIVGLVPTEGSRWSIAAIRADHVVRTERRNLADEPRDLAHVDLAVDDVVLRAAPDGVDDDAFLARGALARAAMSAGALETIAAMTVAYAHERRQFGRPLAAFQAVQEHLVRVTQCAARAVMAVESVTHAAATGADDLVLEVAIARCVVDDAVTEAVAAAHQAHGAIGLTHEYALQRWTRRALAWRHEFGTAREWRRRVGIEIVAGGRAALFPTISR